MTFSTPPLPHPPLGILVQMTLLQTFDEPWHPTCMEFFCRNQLFRPSGTSSNFLPDSKCWAIFSMTSYLYCVILRHRAINGKLKHRQILFETYRVWSHFKGNWSNNPDMIKVFVYLKRFSIFCQFEVVLTKNTRWIFLTGLK